MGRPAKLNNEQVTSIRDRQDIRTVKELASEYGVNFNTIYKVLKFKKPYGVMEKTSYDEHEESIATE